MIDINNLQWMIIVAGYWTFLMAWGIGANDVANAFGTSVGSKVLSIQQAVIAASIFEFAGAFLVGSHVTDTIRKGIVDTNLYINNPGLLMIGMFSALVGGAIWLWFATYLKLPVSSTHSIVGAVIGFSLVAKGFNSIQWNKLGFISLSWVISPIIAGLMSLIIFIIVREGILRRKNNEMLAYLFLPFFYGITIFIITFSIIYHGTPALNLNEIPLWLGIVISISTGIIGGAIAGIFLKPIIKRWIERNEDEFNKLTKFQKFKYLFGCGRFKYEIINFKNESSDKEKIKISIQSENNLISHENNVLTKNDIDDNNLKEDSPLINNYKKKTFWKKFFLIIKKIIFIGNNEEKVENIHLKSETFSSNVESIFSSIQVLTACFASFSHGANDVANAIGPFAALIAIYESEKVEQEAPVNIWILVLGGVGIVVGLAMWGHRVIKTVGERITKVTPARGFVMEFSTATTVILASTLGIPISTTHAQVGSVTGAGIADGNKAINWWLFANIIVSWIVTIPFTAGTSAITFLIMKKIIDI